MKHDPFNESTEMYLKTLTELAPPDEDIAISALAKWLGVSTVSATEMIHRLKEQDLVVHTPYKGVRLTATGRDIAMGIKRSHQLWECFLADHLGLPWEQVHDLACRLEHATEAVVADALDAFLGHPSTCPHGNAISRPGAVADTRPLVTLQSLGPGDRAVVRAIHPESDLLLEHLAQHDLRPGQRVRVVEIAPFNGPFLLEIAGDTHPIGQEVAAHLYVEPL